MVAEVKADYPSEWAAIGAVAQKLGIGSSETLRKWIRQAEVDGGSRPGVTSEEHAEIRRLKREVAELRRRRWGRGLETAFAGTLLGEAPSSTEVDGMRPLIRIDRTELYHWGLLDVLLASWGGALACGSCAHALPGRRSVPWVSGSRDGPRRVGRSQPRPARQAAAPPLRQRFGVDLA